MKKKNGFTLIELLAVIVILAVIALIAVPRIIEILNKSRLSAAEDSTYGIVEAAESYVANFMLQNQGALPSEDLEFSCNSSEGCKLINELEEYNTENLEKLNYKGKNASSGNITISNSGKNIQVTNLNINGFTCNHINDETYCGIREYNSGDEYELGDYNWHVISDDGKYLTLLMDAEQLEQMKHCTDDINPDTDCGVENQYYQYSWDKSLIREYLNGEFLKKIEQSIGVDKLIVEEICADASSGINNVRSYGGYLKSEIESVNGAVCNNYVSDKIRLITLSEYNALSPFFSNNSLDSKLALKPNITRVVESDWLYSNLISSWWTMANYYNGFANNVQYARYVLYNGNISYAFGYETASSLINVRPVITILK